MTETKRKKHVRLLNLSSLLLFTMILLYLCSSLFLRGYANSLAEQVQSVEARIRTLEILNSGIRTDIANIKGSIGMKLDEIGAEEGLTPNMENVLYIHGN